ncbi:hypothetical protein SAMN02745883_02451 [Caminicella sporogenes DSM 14501]|uniref:Uncharacterized protein n=1 Tax=Caminicella sporogenes DSM 14501 TaxID=1121266 RepID=A0A1M6TW68_9FIRM|nr:hypothetical protein [Caminicella sporogenes]WIF95986.1 hypothetical protein QNI18_05265 [Caminicella sporogenes]SHK61134.1 hypothetical protein SAMN02745883_02451 [Caminicella sporogenes DSM 14501]
MKKNFFITNKYNNKKNKFDTKEYKYLSNTFDTTTKTFAIITANRKNRIELFK